MCICTYILYPTMKCYNYCWSPKNALLRLYTTAIPDFLKIDWNGAMRLPAIYIIGFHEHTWIEHCFAPFFWLTNKVTRCFGQQNGQFQFQVANWRQVNSTKMSDLSSWLRQKHLANDPFGSTNVPLSLFLTPSPDVPWSIAIVYYIPDPCGIGIINPFSIGIFWRHSVGIPTMGWMTTKKKTSNLTMAQMKICWMLVNCSHFITIFLG